MIDHFTINKRLIHGVLTKYSTTFEAFCELVTNSIHADAKNIEIRIEASDLLGENANVGFKQLFIRDDGVGVSKSEFKFKILDIATDSKQAQGGKGIGRFAALQLGSRMEIETVAKDPLDLKNYKTRLVVDTKDWHESGKPLDQIPLIVTYDEVQSEIGSYYAVTITNFYSDEAIEAERHLRMLKCFSDNELERALFERYTDIILRGTTRIRVNGSFIVAEDHIVGDVEEAESTFISHTGVKHYLAFKLMQIKAGHRKHKIFLRVANGSISTVAHSYDYSGDIPADHQWISFVDSDYFSRDSDACRGLFMSDLNPDTELVTTAIKERVDEFFATKYASYYDFTTKLKNDSAYPYRQEAASSLTRASVFNQLAFYIEEKHHLLKRKSDLRDLVYRLVDRSLNLGAFNEMLSRILKVDDSVALRFNSVLDQVDIEDVVAFCDDVKEKQQFLDFLYKLNYGDLAKNIGERAQLHKIVQRHLWLFGEEYNDSPILFSDKNLRNNLEKLREEFFAYEPKEEDDNVISDVPEEMREITDLFFFNEKILHADQKEVMIVELKAPRVRIAQKELNQAEKYAYRLDTAGAFPEGIKYKVILIGSDISPILKSKFGQVDTRRRNLLQRSEGVKQVEIWVMKWSDIIEDNRRKLTYLGNILATKDREVQEYWLSEFGEVPTKEVFSKMLDAEQPKEKRKRKRIA